MNCSKLKRMSPTIPKEKVAEIPEAKITLAKETSEVLGYHKLIQNIHQQHTASETKAKLASPSSLFSVLKALDILPFTKESAEAYKQSKTREGMWSGTRNFVLHVGVSVMLFILIIWRITKMGQSNNPALDGTLLGVLAGLLIGNTVFCMMNNIGSGHRTIVDWRWCPLQEFSGDIPEYVLYKAIQIKKAFPDVELRIDYLTKEDWGSGSTSEILPNFFLVARCRSESYYVNFWDKKKYEITL